MSKIKIFVHEISHVSEGAFDRDREFYTTISSRIVVYCNREKLDFSDIRYWHVVEGLRRSIEKQSVPYDHYGYTGDFDVNRNRERSDEVFAKEICDKLNSVTGEDSYEVYKLLPYKESQCRDWDKNLYYDPKNSECCYDITSLFLRYPYLEERYDAFLKKNEVYYGYKLRQEQVLQAEVYKIMAELNSKQQELKKLTESINKFDHRRKGLCTFIAKHMSLDPTRVNEPIRLKQSRFDQSYNSSGLICEFCGKECNVVYPLNIALELSDKQMIANLIDQGAYKLASGFFRDTKNNERKDFHHSIEIILKYYCNDLYYRKLKQNLKENSEWSEELEEKFPDRE